MAIGDPPIYEPVEQIVRDGLGRNLHFTTEVETAIANAEMIFVSVNTPTKMFGHGAGRAADLQYWERTADVCVTDPRALDNARRTLEDVGSAVTFEPDPYRAVKRAHAIALLTDWEEYRYLDYASIYADMEKPAFLFDGRNLLDPQGLHDVGFNVYSVGRPPRTAV